MPAPALTRRQPEEIDFLKLFLFKRNEVTKQSVFILTIFPLFSAPVFGNSVFDDEEIALDPIGKIEYDYEEEYSDLENEILEEDLYVEDFYGDYDETFVPPSTPAPSKSSNPFGIDINFDDYKLSDIRNIEYDYSDYYDEYNEVETEAEEVSEQIENNEKKPYKVVVKNTENSFQPNLKYEYKILKQSNRPNYHQSYPATYFSPTQLKYMGLPQHHPTRGPRPPPSKTPSAAPSPLSINPLDTIINKFRGKVNFLVGAVTRRWQFPKVFGRIKTW